MSEWQPIETAPRDRRVLIWDAETKRCVVAQHMTAIDDGSSAWVYARSLSCDLDGDKIAFIAENPTHWMPEPDAPVIA